MPPVARHKHVGRASGTDQAAGAFEAFVRFSERAAGLGRDEDIVALAFELLGAVLGEVSCGYVQRRGSGWRAQGAWSTLEEVPGGAEALASGVSSFGTSAGEGVWGLYPSHLPDQDGLLAVFSARRRSWSEPERAVLLATGHALSLALERLTSAERLLRRDQELRALQAFAELTRDFGVQQERPQLIGRAQEVALDMLPPGYAVYYEPEGELWRLRVQTGSLHNPELQRVVDAGLPRVQTQNLEIPWHSHQPYYQGSYDQATDQLGELTSLVRASAALPVMVQGLPVGIFAVGLFSERGWNGTDQVVLETVVNSLGLALERAHTLQQLDAQRAELLRANQELDAFAAGVSHDLTAPARHMSGFVSLARQSLQDPERARRYLDVIEHSAARMSKMIGAMLELSRLGRRELHRSSVELAELVREAQRDVQPDLIGRALEWRVSPLPRVLADRATLQQVVTNLISNAVKYTQPQPQARIEVWAEEDPSSWTVLIRDNGVGFDPRYADRLFGVFQRLHRQDEFEGVGVGLANVARIVARHGGRVRAEGALGEGATFSFSLPKTPVGS